jgi:hypothetical protein
MSADSLMAAQLGSARSAWQKSCVVRISHQAAASHRLHFSHWRWVPLSLPHLSLTFPATASYPAASVGHARQRLRTVETPRTRTIGSKINRWPKAKAGHAHPPHRSPTSLSLCPCCHRRSRSPKSSSPSRCAAQLRREQNHASARLPPPLRAALHRAAGRVAIQCGLFSCAGCCGGVSSWSMRAIALRWWFSLVLFFVRGTFFLIRVRGGVRRSDWRLRAGGGVEAMQRQGRHLERSNSKRALDHGDGADDGDRPSKRPRVPALARWLRWTRLSDSVWIVDSVWEEWFALASTCYHVASLRKRLFVIL